MFPFLEAPNMGRVRTGWGVRIEANSFNIGTAF